MKALKDHLFYQDDWATIYCGDCQDVMREMPENSMEEAFRFIGVEREKDSLEIARVRIEHAEKERRQETFDFVVKREKENP